MSNCFIIKIKLNPKIHFEFPFLFHKLAILNHHINRIAIIHSKLYVPSNQPPSPLLVLPMDLKQQQPPPPQSMDYLAASGSAAAEFLRQQLDRQEGK